MSGGLHEHPANMRCLAVCTVGLHVPYCLYGNTEQTGGRGIGPCKIRLFHPGEPYPEFCGRHPVTILHLRSLISGFAPFGQHSGCADSLIDMAAAEVSNKLRDVFFTRPVLRPGATCAANVPPLTVQRPAYMHAVTNRASQAVFFSCTLISCMIRNAEQAGKPMAADGIVAHCRASPAV